MAGNPPAPVAPARSIAVDRAGAELSHYLMNFQEAKQLTTLELLRVLNDCQRNLINLTLIAHSLDKG